VHLVARDWRRASLNDADRALCAFAEKLTQEPAAMSEEDIRRLREHGFDDRAIHDAVQVIGYFNYINRIAEGLDVDLEPFIPAWERPQILEHTDGFQG